MANLTPRKNKDGKIISFGIRVYQGKDQFGKQKKPLSTTFKIPPDVKWSEKTAFAKAKTYAEEFEKNHIIVTENATTMKFSDYCDYVIKVKESRGVKHTTIYLYKYLSKRIYEAIGNYSLDSITTKRLNEFYSYLCSDGIKKNGGKLSPKTIKEYHGMISTVLDFAVKEQFISYNPAKRAILPKYEKPEPNYFQPEEILRIIEALETEPIFWKALMNLYITTGARKGEILGLWWEDVDFQGQSIFLHRNVLYLPDMGVFVDTLKTKKSVRRISVPYPILIYLNEFRNYEKRLNIPCDDKDYIFCSENGSPTSPNSIPKYLRYLSKRYNLPHLNVHAFRHTVASVLLYEGADLISVSNRLGHSTTSTTTNVYAHLIQKADEKNSELLTQAFYQNSSTKSSTKIQVLS